MSDPAEFVVGVDVGSSSARAIAIDRAGSVVGSSVARYSGSEDLPMGDVDPQTWLEGTRTAVASLDRGSPAAICVGGHGPTTVSREGERALTFRHSAGQGGTAAEQHAAQTAALRAEYGPQVQPRQLWDWVLSRMGGSAAIQSVWPGSPILPEFGDVVPVGSVVGTTRDVPEIPDGIPLVPGANDAFLTSWGSGIDVPGRAFDPGGRTGGLGAAVAADVHTDAGKYGMPSAVPGVFILGGPVAAHGTLLDWWSEITGRPIPELLELAAKVAPGAEGVMVLPFLEGERAPRWNHDLRAEILGLHTSSSVGVITRAILESTAYGIGHITMGLREQGVHIDRLVCSGGPSRSTLWCEIKAAVLEIPIDVPECDEMASYGAALGGGAALGWWPRPGEGVSGDWPRPAMTTIEPKPLEVYRAGLARFIALGDEAEARLA
jgi:sugar (pentulose or hexulose) kinase